jgi:hypothetical protein
MDSGVFQPDENSIATALFVLVKGARQEPFRFAHTGLLPVRTRSPDNFYCTALLFSEWENSMNAKFPSDYWCWHVLTYTRFLLCNYSKTG